MQDWETYVKTRVPATYLNFIELAREIMGQSQKEKLRKFINFKFKKHPRYNWSNERLKVIEKLVQMQTILLLRYPSAMIKKYNPLF